LRETDFTTAARMTDAINGHFGEGTARSLDSRTVQVVKPTRHTQGIWSPSSPTWNGLIEPDTPARIVLNERTGTIVMGQDVRISTVAVSHGNLNLVISESIAVSQPDPLSAGVTVAAPGHSHQTCSRMRAIWSFSKWGQYR
jgi:flagellar P-ring protein FlgI